MDSRLLAALNWAAKNQPQIQETIAREKSWYARYIRNKKDTDPVFAAAVKMRAFFLGCLRSTRIGMDRLEKFRKLTGLTPKEMKAWIEAQFLDGMSWENRQEWQIDHVEPVCAFDLRKSGQQRKCFHHRNLRPLWSGDNRSKISSDRTKSRN